MSHTDVSGRLARALLEHARRFRFHADQRRKTDAALDALARSTGSLILKRDYDLANQRVASSPRVEHGFQGGHLKGCPWDLLQWLGLGL